MSRCSRCADSPISGTITIRVVIGGPVMGKWMDRAFPCPDCDGTGHTECATGRAGEGKPYELRHDRP